MDDQLYLPTKQMPAPHQDRDLDDIIFHGEGWLTSDR